jgi:Cft2 family RNA processing exonuclease
MAHVRSPKDRYYFLTHFHSDHYSGLSPSWNYGRIICTRTTANLLINVMGVKDEYISGLEMNESIVLEGGNIRVTFLDANHCPGAALLLFEIGGTSMDNTSSRSASGGSRTSSSVVRYLHTGDMRYRPKMKLYPALQGIKIDKIFLDTTYAHPKHSFPSQEESINEIIEKSLSFFRENPDDGLLMVCSYTIGKERIVCALQDLLGLNVYMDEDKMKLMRCLGDELDIARRIREGKFVTDPTKARIHICR